MKRPSPSSSGGAGHVVLIFAVCGEVIPEFGILSPTGGSEMDQAPPAAGRPQTHFIIKTPCALGSNGVE